MQTQQGLWPEYDTTYPEVLIDHKAYARLSELTDLPLYIADEGLWLMAFGETYSTGTGTKMGLTNDQVETYNTHTMTEFFAPIVESSMASCIGMALSYERAIEVVKAGPGVIKARVFGILGQGDWIEFKYDGKEWKKGGRDDR